MEPEFEPVVDTSAIVEAWRDIIERDITECERQINNDQRRDYQGELSLTPLSPEEEVARKPQPPEELIGALQDRVHKEKGKLISATPIK